ncbi:MAG TPA: metallophosphoesterase family protein [Hyphomicrobiaceae bacterium]|nr:metallophosphoesterase family protein [Hyphomicrobiaceae bacterium]
MRIAVISDIHGNLPALEAVLDDIRLRSADLTVNLGDCCASPLWPRETFELLQSLGLPTVRGNHDRWMGERPRSALSRTLNYEYDQLLPQQRAALGVLPATLEFDHGSILAVHGTPASDETFLLEDRVDSRMHLSTPAQIKARLGHVGAGLVLCGHSHTQQLVHLPAGPVIVNPGSVGLPNYADGPDAPGANARSPHARYAIVTRRANRWSADLIALAYDWDRAARRALDNDRPEWARVYLTGSVLDPETLN